MTSHFPRLREGETVRDPDTGLRYRVGRVSPGAAEIRPLFDTAREVTIGDRTFTAKVGGALLVSPHAALAHEAGQA